MSCFIMNNHFIAQLKKELSLVINYQLIKQPSIEYYYYPITHVPISFYGLFY